LGNYNKKIKTDFIYRPNEEVLREYSLDKNLIDLHKYYLNNDTYLSSSKFKEKSRSFKLDVDYNEIFSLLNKAFMNKKYNEKDIIKNDKEIKHNLLDNFNKEENYKKFSANKQLIKIKDSQNTIKNFNIQTMKKKENSLKTSNKEDFEELSDYYEKEDFHKDEENIQEGKYILFEDREEFKTIIFLDPK